MAFEIDTPSSLATAVDELLPATPTLLGLGEPTHGIKEFLLLRNELVALRRWRAIALETDFFAAARVDDYVNGGLADLDSMLDKGFSHGFGTIPGNRELLEWLRAHNADQAPEDRIRFHGFDAPTEFAAAPSPRSFLIAVDTYLNAGSAAEITALAGDDGDWSNPAAMYDPTKSIGNSDQARALRVIAEDLADAASVDPEAHDLARTALGLLRYHAAMATEAPDRIGNLSRVRSEMMADNLLAIIARERGPVLAFAHNHHLQRTNASAGARVAAVLGPQYVVITSDANPQSEPGTLQHTLASATTRRALFRTEELRGETRAGDPILPGHLPLTPDDLTGADAVVFIADTDGKRHQYW
ncbi:erythromycin esterase family protein [Kutzneria sp. NPDC052558]|uniref:erythromycin esterase family protein n=1 Tax=Kutzneria sp. NPDC052558 TaxID=3364121 RepID=UPI0037C9C794